MAWRFQLCESGTPGQADMPLIGELHNAKDRSLELILNRPGSARFRISLEDELALQIREGTTCIKAWRDGSDGVQRVRWSGPVWSVEENLAERQMSVSAVGWFEQLNKRVIRPTQEATARYQGKDAGAIILGDGTTVTAANSLLGLANNQTEGAAGTGIVRPTHVRAGTFDLSQTRDRAYTRWSSIGQSIQELSDVEAGVDFLVDPSSRQLNVYYALIKSGSGLYGKGQDRPNAQFSIGWGPNNLQGISVASEMSGVANRVTATGKFAAGYQEDTTSTALYGFHEEHQALSDVVDTNILVAFAGAEVAVRAHPRPVYSLVPFPWSPNSGVPRLFDEYDVGDIVYLRARGGRYTIGETNPGQAIRVFGVQISIDDEGNERITSLQTAPS